METAHLRELPPYEHEDGDLPSDTGHSRIVVSRSFVPDHDLYVVGIDYLIANMPTSTLHHVSLSDMSRKNTSCPEIRTGKELFSFSADGMFDNQIRLPPGYALRIPAYSLLSLYLMAHNPAPAGSAGTTYHDVYARVRLVEYTGDPRDRILVEPRLLHVDDIPCGTSRPDYTDSYMFTVPPHASGYAFSGAGRTDAAASFAAAASTTIVTIVGHLHPDIGGKRLVLHRGDHDVYTFVPKPVAGDPSYETLPQVPGRLVLGPGERLWLTATYANPSAVPLRSAMGMLGFYYTEDPRALTQASGSAEAL
jgi:hypothetical protein